MSLTKIEKDNLEILIQDISITIEKHFSHFNEESKKLLESFLPFFVVFYFHILKYDAKNKNWEHKDEIFAMNNFFNILKNILEIHTGHEHFEKILHYINLNEYLKNKNTFNEIIALAEFEKNKNKNHNKMFYALIYQDDIINNFYTNELEYIVKNNLKEILIFVFIKPILEEDFSKITQSGINFYNKKKNLKPILQDHKLNHKLNSIGFDILVINGDDILAIYEAVKYAKNLNKATIILINIK